MEKIQSLHLSSALFDNLQPVQIETQDRSELFSSLSDDARSFQKLVQKGGENSSVETVKDGFIEKIRGDFEKNVFQLEPSLQKEWTDLNSKLSSKISFLEITQKVEKILQDSSLSEKEKQSQIEEVRKNSKMDKSDFKKFFTQRLSSLYKKQSVQIDQQLANLKKQLIEVQKKQGKDSPIATKLKNEIQEIETRLVSLKEESLSKSSICENCYPKKKGFWGKLKGFFKKVGEGISKIVPFVQKALEFLGPIGTLFKGKLRIIGIIWTLFQVGRDALKEKNNEDQKTTGLEESIL